MFEMTFEQQQAFKDAASGTSALVFNHIILMVIGLFATIWLIIFFMGTWVALRQHKIDIGDALLKFALAVSIYVSVGSMIYFNI